MLKDAGHFTEWILDGLMELHMKGKKQWSFAVIGKGAMCMKENQVIVPTCYGDFECPRVYKMKQLGLCFEILTDGTPVCDISAKISRLKEACASLRQISKFCLASTMARLMKAYIITVVSKSQVSEIKDMH